MIIEESAKAAGFTSRLVSETFESNLIHKEILNNIYHDEMVICDVSGRNPNVFFELGIRMATQKPTVIVKDDSTQYPFDTGPNRYVEYRRDLRHASIEKFKADLRQAIERTARHGPSDSFIGQLGPFKVPDVGQVKTSADSIILEKLSAIERRMRLMEPTRESRGNSRESHNLSRLNSQKLSSLAVSISDIAYEDANELARQLVEVHEISLDSLRLNKGSDHQVELIVTASESSIDDVYRDISTWLVERGQGSIVSAVVTPINDLKR